MHYIALATDYDGTIAHDGVVDNATIAALEKLRAGARRIILVTGRELPDLQKAMPRLDLFDVVVAENGALLYWPATKHDRPLAPPADPRFVARLREQRVEPLSVGRAIVATWEPNETKVLEALHELGLELTITFNKGAVMVLPAGINKASGLKAALEALDLSPLNCVAVGDAENDMAFLEIAGASVAVANAVPALAGRAHWVTQGARGEGVAELIDRLLATDLADLDPEIPHQLVALARAEDGQDMDFAPARECLLLVGTSGGGKSTFTWSLTERLADAGFQFCVIDPEGDYDGLPRAVGVGTAEQPATVEQVVEILARTGTNVVATLLGIPLDDRAAFFGVLLPELLALRSRLGRPHFIIVDEAHHMLPPDWDPGGAALPAELGGFLFVTTRPDAVSPRLLCSTDRLLVLGEGASASVAVFREARGLHDHAAPDELPRGEGLVVDVATGTLRRFAIIPGELPRQRHQRNYAEGRLGDDKSFWFRGAEGRLNLRAHNLTLFAQMAEGVDEATWQWHRARGDYSRWIEDAIKDRDLAGEVAEIEGGDVPPGEARRLVRAAIERRYTLPG